MKRDLGEQGLIPTTDRFGSALSDIVRCTACGHMQLVELPAPAVLLEGYAEAETTDYVAEEVGQRWTAGRSLDAIERYVRPGTLLDVGCWVGFLLDEARGRAWQTVGLEPSRFASGYARERFGLDVRTSGLDEVELPSHGFDAAVLADVLEHFVDPGHALDRIRGWLRPGGVLYLALPDAGSRVARVMGRRWWSIIPTHVQYFTRASLRTLLTSRGWQVLEISTAPKAFSISYYLGRLGGYSEAVSRTLVAGSAAAGLAERLWAPDFRDRMAVLARSSGP